MSGPAATNWRDVEGATTDDIIRKEIAGEGVALKQVTIPAGTEAGRHDHPFEQFIQVISGSGVLQCGAGEVKLEPGTVVHLPAGSWHSAIFETDTVLVEVNLAS